MQLTADPGQYTTLLSAPAGSDDALRLLASWAATREQARATPEPR